MLRAKRKARTRARLLEAAGALFARDGVAGTRMDAIAAEAEVGTGTLYNYFPSKAALLLALAGDALSGLLAEGEKVLAAPDPDPVRAVCDLLDAHLSVAETLGRPLLREVISAAFSLPPETAASLVAMDRSLMQQVTTLLAQLAARGALRGDLDLAQVSFLLYGIMGGALMGFVGMPEVPLAGFRAMVHGQVRMAFEGLAP